MRGENNKKSMQLERKIHSYYCIQISVQKNMDVLELNVIIFPFLIQTNKKSIQFIGTKDGSNFKGSRFFFLLEIVHEKKKLGSLALLIAVPLQTYIKTENSQWVSFSSHSSSSSL